MRIWQGRGGSQHRAAVVERLRRAVAARKSWAAVEELLAELEEVL